MNEGGQRQAMAFSACDDCGEPTELLAVWLQDSTIDALCVACLIRRLLPIIASAVSETPDAAAVS